MFVCGEPPFSSHEAQDERTKDLLTLLTPSLVGQVDVLLGHLVEVSDQGEGRRTCMHFRKARARGHDLRLKWEGEGEKGRVCRPGG